MEIKIAFLAKESLLLLTSFGNVGIKIFQYLSLHGERNLQNLNLQLQVDIFLGSVARVDFKANTVFMARD